MKSPVCPTCGRIIIGGYIELTDLGRAYTDPEPRRLRAVVPEPLTAFEKGCNLAHLCLACPLEECQYENED